MKRKVQLSLKSGAAGESPTPKMELSKFGYFEGENWSCLPEWAHFFINLGAFVAALPPQSERDWRTVIAISVPTRIYAATFVAVGVVLSRAAVGTASPDAQEHFKYLCSLPINTHVEIVKYQRKWKGVLSERSQYEGKLILGVRVQGVKREHSKGQTFFVGVADSLIVTVADSEIGADDLPGNPTGRKIHAAGPLAEAMLGRKAADSLMVSSRLECIFVGRKNRFCQEVQEAQFGLRLPDESLARGTLQDLLRVRTVSPNHAYRCDIIAARSKRWTDEVEASPVAILDGAPSLYSAYRRCKCAHVVSILDRTEHGYGPAVDAINEYYRQRGRQGSSASDALPGWPNGVEVMTYREAIR